MVFANPPESALSQLNQTEQFTFVALFSLIMLDRHGVIPANVLPQFVEVNLVKVYTYDVGIGGKNIPFVRLTKLGRKEAKSAYRSMQNDPGAVRMFDKDIFSERNRWPNVKFLMNHQRFVREVNKSPLDSFRADYDMDFPIIGAGQIGRI